MAGFLDYLKDPRFLNSVGTDLQAGGQFVGALGYLKNATAAKAQGDFMAQQLREQAGDALAVSQRKAWSDQRQTDYVASETLARAAASGGGASDPTVVNLIAQQAAEGSYRKSVDLYNGNSRARLLDLEAQAKQFEGNEAQSVGKRAGGTAVMGVGTTLLKGYAKDSSILARFGAGGPRLPGDIATWDGS